MAGDVTLSGCELQATAAHDAGLAQINVTSSSLSAVIDAYIFVPQTVSLNIDDTELTAWSSSCTGGAAPPRST